MHVNTTLVWSKKHRLFQKKNWTNLNLNAKSKVYASFREVRKIGGSTDNAGHLQDEDLFIMSTCVFAVRLLEFLAFIS